MNSHGAVNSLMRDIGKELGENVEFIHDYKSFSNPKHKKKVQAFIKNLEEKFSKAGSHFEMKSSTRPFYLQVMKDQLAELKDSFSQGNKIYSHFLLRQVPGMCMTCHLSDNKSLRVFKGLPSQKKLSDLDKATYFQSTRQYEEAIESYISYLSSDKLPRNPMKVDFALEEMLVCVVAAKKFSDEELERLRNLPFLENIPLLLKSKWRESLLDVKKRKTDGVYELKNYSMVEIDKVLNKKSDFYNDDYVTSAFDDEKIDMYFTRRMLQDSLGKFKAPKDRQKILYYLGKTELSLERNVFHSIGGLYLRTCIEKYEKSDFSNRCFSLYRNYVISLHTGSRGTDLPMDVKLHLKELNPKKK
jgi:hypothetical protein